MLSSEPAGLEAAPWRSRNVLSQTYASGLFTHERQFLKVFQSWMRPNNGWAAGCIEEVLTGVYCIMLHNSDRKRPRVRPLSPRSPGRRPGHRRKLAEHRHSRGRRIQSPEIKEVLRAMTNERRVFWPMRGCNYLATAPEPLATSELAHAASHQGTG